MDLLRWVKQTAIPWYTSLGLSSRTVTLEVPGRKSGKPRRTSLSRTESAGEEFFVSLGGDAEWVKNVRAAGGKAVIISRKRRMVCLEEIPLEQRPLILLAYVQKRAFTHSGPQAARHFFGLSAHPTLGEMEAIADRYIVFRITADVG